MNVAPVDYLRQLTRAEQIRFLASLPRGALAAVATDPRFWARPAFVAPDGQRYDSQLLPEHLAPIELITGGFGAGKTQAGMWCFMREWIAGRAPILRMVSSTQSQVEATLINGDSGIWKWLPHRYKARVGFDVERAYTVSRGHAGTFAIPGLPTINCLAYEKPGSFQGAGAHLTLADDPAAAIEVCGERKVRLAFEKMRTSTRVGRSPCVILPTTTGGVQFLRRALNGNMLGVHRTRLRSAHDNTALAPSYVEQVIGDLIGQGDDSDWTGIETTATRGALWQPEWISAHRVAMAPELARVVVAIDPADTGDARADAVGIVVVGIGHDGRLYVLADYTAQWTAPQWAAIAAWCFRRYKADAIVCEMNRSESAVRACLAVAAPGLHIVGVDATRDKATRAGPCAMLHEAGLVSWVADGPQLHRPGAVWIKVPIFDPATGQREEVDLEVKRSSRGWQTLEDELCGWVPLESRRSPGGLDALVWACWYLRPPDGAGFAATERNAGVGAIEGRYTADDPRLAGFALGIGGIEGRNVDPRNDAPRW